MEFKTRHGLNLRHSQASALIPVMAVGLMLCHGCGKQTLLIEESSHRAMEAAGDESDEFIGETGAARPPRLEACAALPPRHSAAAPTLGRALLVGVNRTQTQGAGPLADARFDVLQGTEQDVDAVARLLHARGFEVRCLLNEEATAEGVAEAFQEHLISGISSKDEVALFYYSGHGLQVPDQPVEGRDEEDGYDEALIPFAASGAAPEDQIIRDDTLAAWFHALNAKTPHAVAIIDSCHAGTITRGGHLGRLRANRASAPPPTQTPLAQPQSARFELPQGMVALMASGATEVAREYRPDAARPEVFMGGFTYALLRSIERLHPDATYQDLLALTRATLGHMGLSQHPQSEGATAKRAFQGALGHPLAAHLIRPSHRNALTIEAGHLHGLTQGSTLRLYPLHTAPEDLSDEALSLGEGAVGAVGLTTAQVRIPSAIRATIAAHGALGVISRIGLTPGLFTVSVDPDRSPLSAEQLQELRRLLDGHPTLTWRDDDADAVVRRCDPGVMGGCPRGAVVLDGGSRGLLPIPVAKGQPMVTGMSHSTPGLIEHLLQALEAQERRRRLLALVNPNPERRISVKVTVVHEDSGQPADTLLEGQRHRLLLTNPSSKAVHYSVLALNPDGSIVQLLHSEDGGRFPPLGAGEERVVKELLLRRSEPAGVTHFVIIASEGGGLDLSPLEMPIAARHQVVGHRDEPDPLKALIFRALSPDRARLVTRAPRVRWGVGFAMVRVAPL